MRTRTGVQFRDGTFAYCAHNPSAQGWGRGGWDKSQESRGAENTIFGALGQNEQKNKNTFISIFTDVYLVRSIDESHNDIHSQNSGGRSSKPASATYQVWGQLGLHETVQENVKEEREEGGGGWERLRLGRLILKLDLGEGYKLEWGNIKWGSKSLRH